MSELAMCGLCHTPIQGPYRSVETVGFHEECYSTELAAETVARRYEYHRAETERLRNLLAAYRKGQIQGMRPMGPMGG